MKAGMSLFVGIVLLLGSRSGLGMPRDCAAVQQHIMSSNETEFFNGLKAMVRLQCREMYSKAAEMLRSGRAPLPGSAAIALSLLGEREYGPLVVRQFYEASEGHGREVNPYELKEAVILACTNLPRGKDIEHVNDYRQGMHPALDDSCVRELRELLAANADEYVRRAAMSLLAQTATPSSIDIIEATLEVSGRQAREEAVLALQYLPFSVAAAAFRRAMADSDVMVRYQAVQRLVKHEDAGVVDLLRSRMPLEEDGGIIEIMKQRLAREVK